MWGHMDGYGGMAGYGGWMAFGGLTMLLFWVILVLVIAALWKYLRPQQPPVQPPSKTALEILEERYARGEIDSEQFRQMRSELKREGDR